MLRNKLIVLVFNLFTVIVCAQTLSGSDQNKGAGNQRSGLTHNSNRIIEATNLPFKLLFSGEKDLVDTWGKLHISVTPTEWINRNAARSVMNSDLLSTWPVACFPLTDGSWVVYSQKFATINTTFPATTRWSLLRGITTDGVNFKNVETVIKDTTGRWTNHLSMALNPDAGEYMLLKMDIDPRGTNPNDSNGFVYHAWFSTDGKTFRKYVGNRPRGGLFYEGDAVSSFWSPVLKRFVVVSKSLQAWPKHIRDHGRVTSGGIDRRVLMIRSSPDGRNWTPDGDLINVFGLNPNQSDDYYPTEWYTMPDEIDPPDLEFYSGTAFWYHDRAYMMVLNYAASPMFPNKHGEELDNEWWTSADGLNWERPAREVNALGTFMDGKKRINMPPLIIDGKLQWQFGWNEDGNGDVVLAGVKEDRISGVSARSNGEFSTKNFTMPEGDLYLNAAVPSLDRPWLKHTSQPYVMIEVRNQSGNVISGFERSKCVIWDGTTSPNRKTQVDVTNQKLTWNGTSAKSLAGQTISLRFYLGGSTIYAVTSNATPTAIESIRSKSHSLISIYPNPTTDIVYFKNLPENSRVILVDLMGRILLEKKASELTTGISLQLYSNGLYLIKVTQGKEILQLEKVLKK
jgi:hypothetical protein